MTEKIDVKETKELLTFVCKLGNAISGSLADGKIDAADVAHLYSPLTSALPAFQGITKMGAEMKDLDVAEAMEIKTHIATELSLDISNKEIEELTEMIAGTAFNMAAMIMAITAAKATP